MDNCILVFHVATGDNLTLYSAIMHYSMIYKNVYIFCLYRNRNTVKQLYKKIPNIHIVLIENPEYNFYMIPAKDIEKLEKKLVNYDKIVSGCYSKEWVWDAITEKKVWRIFYDNMKLDYNIRNNYKKINREHNVDIEFYKEITKIYGTQYIFVHDHRNLIYKHYDHRTDVNIEHSLPIFHPNINYYGENHKYGDLWSISFIRDNLFDYCKIIEEATEIHILDSSFSCLCPFLNLSKVKKKFIYTGWDYVDYHESFKDWTIIRPKIIEKILITGGSGLIGNSIKNISKNYKNYEFIFLSSKECNLLNWDETLKYFQNKKPNYVIHLAANVGGLFKNMNYKVDMLEDNLLINLNVLKASHMVKVKKLVACLSTCIFPDKTTYPINEEMLHLGPPHFSNDAYAYAKRILEIQCKSYREQYGDNFVCVIPTNIYGPFDNFNLNDGHVIPSLIHKCYLAKKNNEPFVIAGTGKPLRQFIYSQDLAELILLILFNYKEHDSIILSVNPEDEIAIKDVVNIICKKYDYRNVLWDTTKSDGQFKKTADNTKLRKIIDYKFTKIEDGLNNTIEWFIENYDICRK